MMRILLGCWPWVTTGTMGWPVAWYHQWPRDRADKRGGDTSFFRNIFLLAMDRSVFLVGLVLLFYICEVWIKQTCEMHFKSRLYPRFLRGRDTRRWQERITPTAIVEAITITKDHTTAGKELTTTITAKAASPIFKTSMAENQTTSRTPSTTPTTEEFLTTETTGTRSLVTEGITRRG